MNLKRNFYAGFFDLIPRNLDLSVMNFRGAIFLIFNIQFDVLLRYAPQNSDKDITVFGQHFQGSAGIFAVLAVKFERSAHTGRRHFHATIEVGVLIRQQIINPPVEGFTLLQTNTLIRIN